MHTIYAVGVGSGRLLQVLQCVCGDPRACACALRCAHSSQLIDLRGAVLRLPQCWVNIAHLTCCSLAGKWAQKKHLKWDSLRSEWPRSRCRPPTLPHHTHLACSRSCVCVCVCCDAFFRRLLPAANFEAEAQRRVTALASLPHRAVMQAKEVRPIVVHSSQRSCHSPIQQMCVCMCLCSWMLVVGCAVASGVA